MECVESALKGSFRNEMTLKLNHQAVFDDLPNAGLTSLTADDFFVDDLFDFSKMNDADGEDNNNIDEVDVEKNETTKPCAGALLKEKGGGVEKEKSETCGNFMFKEDELSVTADDVADLEWLSHFIEDSYSLSCPAAALLTKTNAHPPPSPSPPPLPVEVSGKPARARSKRVHDGVVGCSVSGSETSSWTSSSSSTSFSSASTWLIYPNHTTHRDAVLDSLAKPPPPLLTTAVKNRKSQPPLEPAGGTGSSAAQTRRCSHCGVQKTAQWRAGPSGPKTLCNACGVRFKSGRLFPEYRPACSPTFSSDLHSNHHKKVLEMRLKKELELPVGLRPPPSF